MKTFINVAQMKLATLQAGQFVETGGEVVKGDGGQARYLVTAGASPDDSVSPDLANGNHALYQGVGAVNDLSQAYEFKTRADMENSVIVFPAEKRYKTKGFYTIADGGGAEYIQTAGVSPDIGSPAMLSGYAKINNLTDIRQFGAKEEVSFDSTVFIQAMSDSAGYVGIPKTTIPFEIDNITSTVKTAFYATDGAAFVKARTPTIAGKPMVILGADGDSWAKEINIDVNNTSRSAVKTSADHQRADVVCKNISADLGSSAVTSALNISSGTDFLGSCHASEVYNSGHTNESVPRTISIDAGYGDYYLTRVQVRNANNLGTGGGIVAGGGDGVIDTIVGEGNKDNILYGVGGDCSIDCKNLYTRDIEEGVVASGGSEISVGNWHHYGNASWLIGIDDCQRLNIDNLTIHPDPRGTAEIVSGVMRARSGNGSSNVVRIGNLSGVGPHNQLIDCSVGTINYMTIESINYTYEYDLTHTGAVSQWLNLTACRGYNIKDFNIKIKDVNDIMSGEVFQMQLPFASGNLAFKSYAKDIKVTFVDSLESAATPAATLRISSADEPLVYTFGYDYQVNIGPYARETNNNNGNGQSVSAVPTVGNWKEGEDFAIKGATSAPFRARCTVTGTPGTWVTY